MIMKNVCRGMAFLFVGLMLFSFLGADARYYAVLDDETFNFYTNKVVGEYKAVYLETMAVDENHYNIGAIDTHQTNVYALRDKPTGSGELGTFIGWATKSDFSSKHDQVHNSYNGNELYTASDYITYFYPIFQPTYDTGVGYITHSASKVSSDKKSIDFVNIRLDSEVGCDYKAFKLPITLQEGYYLVEFEYKYHIELGFHANRGTPNTEEDKFQNNTKVQAYTTHSEHRFGAAILNYNEVEPFFKGCNDNAAHWWSAAGGNVLTHPCPKSRQISMVNFEYGLEDEKVPAQLVFHYDGNAKGAYLFVCFCGVQDYNDTNLEITGLSFIRVAQTGAMDFTGWEGETSITPTKTDWITWRDTANSPYPANHKFTNVSATNGPNNANDANSKIGNLRFDYYLGSGFDYILLRNKNVWTNAINANSLLFSMDISLMTTATLCEWHGVGMDETAWNTYHTADDNRRENFAFSNRILDTKTDGKGNSKKVLTTEYKRMDTSNDNSMNGMGISIFPGCKEDIYKDWSDGMATNWWRTYANVDIASHPNSFWWDVLPLGTYKVPESSTAPSDLAGKAPDYRRVAYQPYVHVFGYYKDENNNTITDYDYPRNTTDGIIPTLLYFGGLGDKSWGQQTIVSVDMKNISMFYFTNGSPCTKANATRPSFD